MSVTSYSAAHHEQQLERAALSRSPLSLAHIREVGWRREGGDGGGEEGGEGGGGASWVEIVAKNGCHETFDSR